jgi:hypothetical protein
VHESAPIIWMKIDIKTHRVHVDPILLGIVLSARKFCDALALGGRNIIHITLHLIRGANCARSSTLRRWHNWRAEWGWASDRWRWRLVTEWLS